jgi:tight adherence protein C
LPRLLYRSIRFIFSAARTNARPDLHQADQDPHFLLSVLVALATMATIVTIAMPLIESDTLSQRMKSAATERERIRARERERLMPDKGKRGLRQEPKAYMKQIVERFNLSKWLGTAQAKSQMAMAGFRGPQAEVAFLFFRLVASALSLALSAAYIFVVTNFPAGWTIESRYCPLRHLCRLKGARDLS